MMAMYLNSNYHRAVLPQITVVSKLTVANFAQSFFFFFFRRLTMEDKADDLSPSEGVQENNIKENNVKENNVNDADGNSVYVVLLIVML